MNPTEWGQLAAALAVAVTAVAALGAIIASRIKSTAIQRTVWRATSLVILALAVCQINGIGRGLRPQRSSPTQPGSRMFSLLESQPGEAETGKLQNPEPSTTKGVRALLAAQAGRSIWWPGLVWLAGAAVVITRRAVGRSVLMWRRRRWLPSQDASLRQSINALATRMGLGRAVTLLNCTDLPGPIAFGILRPSVCLPGRFTQDFTKTQQDVMLAHELAHLAAKDPFWYGVADHMVALVWWHPLSWWVHRQLQSSSERAADDASLLVRGGPGALAECLVLVAQRLTQTGRFGGLGIEGNGFRSGLGQRVTRLLQLSEGQWHGTVRSASWLAATLGALTLVGILAASAAWTDAMSAGSGRTQPGWSGSAAGKAWTQIARPEGSALLAQATTSPTNPNTVSDPTPTQGSTAASVLHTRNYQLDPRTLAQALTNTARQTPGSVSMRGGSTNSMEARLVSLLTTFGIDLSPPKAFFLNESTGVLMARGTLEDLDLVERTVQVLNTRPPQLVIEIKLVELAEGETVPPGLASFLTTNPKVVAASTARPQSLGSGASIGKPLLQSATNVAPAPLTGILTPTQFRTILAGLRANILSAPKVTTLSGRQTQVKAVDVRYIVTDLDLNGKDSIQPIATPFEFGPVLDVLPRVTADGYNIEMSIIASVKEFLGYDMTNIFNATIGGKTMPVPQPSFRVRQVTAAATAWDGQTVVVGSGTVEVDEPSNDAAAGNPTKKVRKTLLVFVTPTIIDPAGNRVHSEKEVERQAELSSRQQGVSR